MLLFSNNLSGEQVTCPSREYKSHRPDVGLHLEDVRTFVAFPRFLLDVVEEDNSLKLKRTAGPFAVQTNLAR